MAVRIHGYLISTWTRTACMACAEKGVDYELVPLKRFTDEHEAMHPFKRMPVLEHDGRMLTEGLAITGYVEEAFEGRELVPRDLEQRARMRQWQSMCADYGFRQVVRGIPRDRDPSGEELAEARGVLERFDAFVGEAAFLVGEAMTLADIYLAPQVANAREKAPQLLDALDALGAWFDRVAERESFTSTRYEPPGR
ncbi:MAG TPA: glutathione S-transferase family protein [Solirubrobacteraceae bacterium]|nr:glutathione S-transferase family protein [Solirubrobacteraceae bacterium]